MPKLSPEKRLEWEERIRKQRASGLSMEKWCGQNQVPLHRFYYWRDRLFPKPELSRSTFTEVVPKNEPTICIEYRGVRIHLDKYFDPLLLKRCHAALGELKCKLCRIMSGFFSAKLLSIKYAASEKLAQQKIITWYPCWSHIRSKFYEAEAGDRDFRAWVLRKIKYLFMLERVAWASSAEEKLKIRQEKEEPIINELVEQMPDSITTWQKERLDP